MQRIIIEYFSTATDFDIYSGGSLILLIAPHVCVVVAREQSYESLGVNDCKRDMLEATLAIRIAVVVVDTPVLVLGSQVVLGLEFRDKHIRASII